MKVGKGLLGLGMVVALTSTAMAGSLSVGGNYFGGYNDVTQKNAAGAAGNLSQFDSVANIDLNYKVSDKLSGTIQLQAGAGGGGLFDATNTATITDANFTYKLDKKGSITMGSFDMPLGLYTSRLTNNAALSSPLVVNPLMFSALGGKVGTLNTIGAKYDRKIMDHDVTIALTNGTDESAANGDGSLGYVVSMSKDHGKATTGLTYIASNDTTNGGTGLNADLTGVIFDLHYDINATSAFRSYYSVLSFGDNTAATDDQVTTWMVELTCNKGMIQKALRVSSWTPDDSNGGGSGQSSVLPSPGLATTQGGVAVVTDQTVIRYEVGLGYELDENVTLVGSYIMDDYAQESSGEDTDVSAIVVGANVSF
ncbi:hypothetical protein HOH87_05980 [bacterium]|jgi:hypothetical protein|nr:hypothetical protein [bacterium]